MSQNSASDTTLLRKRRVLYADKVKQETLFANGLKQTIQLEGGNYVGAMTYTPHYYNMLTGPLFTTEEERLAYIASVPGSVPPVSVPGAPTSLAVIATGGDYVSVSFTAPASDGGAPITNYQYSTNDGVNFTPLSPADSSSPVIIRGLNTSTVYQIKLSAVNSAGAGAASAALSVTTLSSVSAPGTPTLELAVADNSSAYIYFVAGSTGNAYTTYEYSLDGGSWTPHTPVDTTSPIRLTSLTNGTEYAIRLRAVNSAGQSAASNSLSVIPVAPSVATPWLYFDPSNASSYSGSGATVSNIGSYGALTGTKASAVTYNASIKGGVFDFPGTTGSVISFSPFDFGTTITVTAWVYPRPTTNINGLLTNASAGVQPTGFKMQWNTWGGPSGTGGNSRVIGLQAGNGSTGGDNLSVANTIVYNTWQHLAYVFDQANQRIIFYHNGVPVDMGTDASPVAGINTNAAFNIGGYIGGSYTMSAQLGYLKVFNTLLDATQIYADYNASASRFA